MPDLNPRPLCVAAGLALFTIIFGTRNLDANERHHGVVTAIAVEAVVKLVALLAVGIFVVWGVAAGPADVWRRSRRRPSPTGSLRPDRWATLIFLSAAAFLCLPRMFQVLVVENSDERHLATASWAFPLYLFLMSLFVMPIAVVGLSVLPAGSNPDLFVLTAAAGLRPGGAGDAGVPRRVLVGHVDGDRGGDRAVDDGVEPHRDADLADRRDRAARRCRATCGTWCCCRGGCRSRACWRWAIFYFRLSGGGAALAAIGLIAFTGVAQILPALLGGIFWRGATRVGAAVGLIIGFAVWAWTSFLPSFGEGFVMSVGAVWPRGRSGSAGCDRRRCSGSRGWTRWCMRSSGRCR